MTELNERIVLKECKTATMYQKSIECYLNCEIELGSYEQKFNIYDNVLPFINVTV